jgi:uncharacterized protein (TIGR04255 family)
MCTTVCTAMSEHTPPLLRAAPLQTMVCELRFPNRLGVQNDAVRLQQSLLADYPSVETQGGLVVAQGNLPTPTQRFVFASVDGSHAVLLTASTLALECRSGYEGWKFFCDRWTRVLEAAANSFGDLAWQQRIGLRYVNQLDAKASDGLTAMKGRINPSLLHPLEDDESGLFNSIDTSFQELRVAQKFGVCTVRHGFQVAEGDDKAAYILDFDYYDDTMVELDKGSQIELLNNFNLGVWNIFRWCLTEQQYVEFKPEARE